MQERCNGVSEQVQRIQSIDGRTEIGDSDVWLPPTVHFVYLEKNESLSCRKTARCNKLTRAVKYLVTRGVCKRNSRGRLRQQRIPAIHRRRRANRIY